MLASASLFAAALVGADSLNALAKPDPTCTQGKIPAVRESISSAHAHPSLFCSAYLKIPANVQTTTTTT